MIHGKNCIKTMRVMIGISKPKPENICTNIFRVLMISVPAIIEDNSNMQKIRKEKDRKNWGLSSSLDSTNFVDETVDSGKVYFYELKVYDSGGLSSSSNVFRVALIKGFALRFDGIDDFVTILSGTTQLISPSFTLEMWVSWQNTTQQNLFLSRKLNEFEILLYPNGYMIQFFSCRYDQGNYTMPAFQWVHLAISFDAPSTNYKLYINGNLAYTGSCGTYEVTSGNILIGKRVNNSSPYTGYIDEFRYWDHARSSTEIMNNYRKFIPTAAGLIGRWSFDEGSGSTFGDVGPTGTISGATWEVSTAPIEY